MVIVKQYFQHSCVLACLQSFLADNFVTLTQSKMICKFPDICNKDRDIEGCVRVNDIGTLCQNLDILSEKVDKIIPATE